MSDLASGQSGLALAAVSGADLLALAVALADTLELLADLLDAGAARSGDVGGVTVVGVDANQVGDTPGLDVLDDDMAGATVVGAVTASAVELAGVDDGEVLDGDGSAAVVLDNLVLGLLGTTALDQDVAIAEGRDGIYKV